MGLRYLFTLSVRFSLNSIGKCSFHKAPLAGTDSAFCAEGPGHELSTLASHSALFTDRAHLLLLFMPIRVVTAGLPMAPPTLQPPGSPSLTQTPVMGRFSPLGRHKVKSDLLLPGRSQKLQSTNCWLGFCFDPGPPRAQRHSGSHQSPGSPSDPA